TSLQLQSSVGTALARASVETTQLAVGALPAALPRTSRKTIPELWYLQEIP
ncbi:MAG: hypothetical protein JKY45_14765, partial [Emcibacter sp.]|nr:hypothetical protein [Emcibacter sp.]